jgi:hypothetical protein
MEKVNRACGEVGTALPYVRTKGCVERAVGIIAGQCEILTAVVAEGDGRPAANDDRSI